MGGIVLTLQGEGLQGMDCYFGEDEVPAVVEGSDSEEEVDPDVPVANPVSSVCRYDPLVGEYGRACTCYVPRSRMNEGSWATGPVEVRVMGMYGSPDWAPFPVYFTYASHASSEVFSGRDSRACLKAWACRRFLWATLFADSLTAS